MVFYPGLNPTERKLVVGRPKEAVTVFIQKTRAELSSARNFPDQGRNDEGDAFRHYIWSALLRKELGVERAKVYLDAHEEDPDQPLEEKNMDDFNNSVGLKSAEKLIGRRQLQLAAS